MLTERVKRVKARCGDSTFAGYVPQVVASYSPARQGVTDATADVVLTLPSPSLDYACVRTLAFDPSGNLWVGLEKGILLLFAKTALAATGTPTPTVTLSGLGPGALTSMRFDTTGNLFIATQGTQQASSLVKRLSVAQLASTAQVVPDSTFAIPSGYDAGHLTFDANGNLWVPTASQSQGAISFGQLLRFDANKLASATATPSIVIDTNQDLLAAAFDNTGAVWVNGWSNGGWGMFVLDRTQIAQSTTTKLSLSKGFVGSSWALANLAFDPPH